MNFHRNYHHSQHDMSKRDARALRIVDYAILICMFGSLIPAALVVMFS